MKGIYLGAKKHRIAGYDIVYNDICQYDGIDLCCDMLAVDLKKFDYIIATPPCNWYSHANYRRDSSAYALSTKHLLPDILYKCQLLDKPFIIENVCNVNRLPKADCYEFNFGQHHFYTNVFMFVPHKSYAVRQNKQYTNPNQRDGNYNVDLIIRLFLEIIHNEM